MRPDRHDQSVELARSFVEPSVALDDFTDFFALFSEK